MALIWCLWERGKVNNQGNEQRKRENVNRTEARRSRLHFVIGASSEHSPLVDIRHHFVTWHVLAAAGIGCRLETKSSR